MIQAVASERPDQALKHMGNAKATSVMSGDLEFPLLGLEL
jgi:hypothetical protein